MMLIVQLIAQQFNCCTSSIDSKFACFESKLTFRSFCWQVAPRKKNRIYGVGSLQQEAASAHSGPPPTTEDPDILAQKLANAEAALKVQATQLQKSAEKMHQVFQYLSKKDPVFAAMFEDENESRTTNTEANQVSTPETTPVTPVTGDGANPGNGTATASLSKSF